MLIFAQLANLLDLLKISMDRKPIAGTIRFAEFEKVDFRAGTIVKAEPFPQARKPATGCRPSLGRGVPGGSGFPRAATSRRG